MGKRKRKEKKPKLDGDENVGIDQSEDQIPGLEGLPEEVLEEPLATKTSEDTQNDVDLEDDQEAAQSRKKRRKLKHAGKSSSRSAETHKSSKTRPDAPQPPPPAPPQATKEQPVSGDLPSNTPAVVGKAAKDPSKPNRYILFIGNLPFKTTTKSIQRHFSALAPGFTIRHSTDKNTGKSRGFAFLEFENDVLMRRCLKSYHHSIFYAGDPPPEEPKEMNVKDDTELGANAEGIHPARLRQMSGSKQSANRPRGGHSRNGSKPEEGRRINIELTAGGGGKNSTVRKEKLKAKNEKLHQERTRIRETQMKIAERTERRIDQRKKSMGPGGTGANAGGVTGTKKRLQADANN